MTSKWRQKCSLVAGYWTVNPENLGRGSVVLVVTTKCWSRRNILLLPRRNIVYKHGKNSMETDEICYLEYTAISRKVVGESARDNPERYCGWFWVHCSSKKFKRIAREAMDVCLRLLKESNKGRFDSYSVRNGVLIISPITFRDRRVPNFFRQPFSK